MTWRRALVAVATSLLPLMAVAADSPDEAAVKAQPIKAVWQYSEDEGKTFTDVRPEKAKGLVARATFTVDDPAAMAGLWLTHEDPKAPDPLRETKPVSGFAMDSQQQARAKENGASPMWTYTKVTLNGKNVTGPQESMFYVALPLEPAGLLVKGQNTLTVSGVLCALEVKKGPCPTKPLQLLAASPQPARILGGPLVGMIGPDFVTINCATEIPAAVTVTATPLEPAGATTQSISPVGLYHQVKVAVPAGTRKFSYTIASRVGTHESKIGPFTAKLPAPDGRGFKLVAMGNTRCHRYSAEGGPRLAAQMIKTDPDMFVHVGQVVDLAPWDFRWESSFYTQFRPLISTVPTYLSPDGGDHVGRLFRAFGTPAGDDKPMNWTQVFGDVRLIGCDGAYDWSADTENHKWLESILKEAKEKYIIVFDHFPGYTDGYQSSPPSGVADRNFKPIKQCREVILPMLGKYKATALVSAYDYNYERLEPTPDKGVTCIIVGAGGAKTYCQGATNLFTGTAKWIRESSFAQFEVKSDCMEMTAINIDGKPIDSKTFKPR